MLCGNNVAKGFHQQAVLKMRSVVWIRSKNMKFLACTANLKNQIRTTAQLQIQGLNSDPSPVLFIETIVGFLIAGITTT